MTFSNGLRFVSDEATLLVKKLPWSVAEAVAEALAPVAVGDWATCRASAVRDLAHAHYRSLVVAFLDGWREHAADVSPQAVAAALLTAASTAKAYSEHQSVELVWTGPDVGVVPLRRTEQVILQVIEAATARLLVVSYAVYNIPRVCEALVRAADRGVAINVIVESPDRIEGQNAYSTIAALGTSVASRCGVYLWPLEQRAAGRERQAGHPARQVRRGRWPVAVPVERQPDGVCLHAQHGAWAAVEGRGLSRAD